MLPIHFGMKTDTILTFLIGFFKVSFETFVVSSVTWVEFHIHVTVSGVDSRSWSGITTVWSQILWAWEVTIPQLYIISVASRRVLDIHGFERKPHSLVVADSYFPDTVHVWRVVIWVIWTCDVACCILQVKDLRWCHGRQTVAFNVQCYNDRRKSVIIGDIYSSSVMFALVQWCL